ncbi:MAG: c-type cytochrome, partial [Dehalococcoidia bacterium]
QSIADPSAHVVEGYKDEMPFVYKPPISLTPDEVRAVLTYLQTLGGEVDITAIKLPGVILEAAAAGAVEEAFRVYQEGDPVAGKTLFFDQNSTAGCAQCHAVSGEGGDIGPELTDVASVRTLPFIIESILFPSAEIASGFEAVLLRTTDGRTINGVLRDEDEVSITLVTKEGEEIVVLKSDISRRAEDQPSLMPDNYGELLSVKQFHDILAFLQTGQEEE